MTLDLKAIKERAEKWPYDIGQAKADIDILITEAEKVERLEAEIARLREALKAAASEHREAKPTWQCPNCGGWNHAYEGRHSSSTQHGTIYGVCKKCADDHASFASGWTKSALSAQEGK